MYPAIPSAMAAPKLVKRGDATTTAPMEGHHVQWRGGTPNVCNNLVCCVADLSGVGSTHPATKEQGGQEGADFQDHQFGHPNSKQLSRGRRSSRGTIVEPVGHSDGSLRPSLLFDTSENRC